MAETWLRIVGYHVPESTDLAALRGIKTTIQQGLHKLEQQAGFQLCYLGQNIDAGRMAAVTYWNSHQAMDDAAADMRALLELEPVAAGVSVESVRSIRLFAVPTGLPAAPV